ncbi:MAG TPA: hypothetical protein VM051_00685 [Usitatibacter sp.]|nr:hypothetical protein [Usitatibacter sp.]
MATFRRIAALVSSLAISAFATPQPIDATGLWIKADESGWGLSVYHQGDTLFASLFTYGPDGQPKWYTASSLTAGPTVYSGVLAEATGPYFGASSFDPGSVSRTPVGNMTMTLDDTAATLNYSVNGVQVSKRITRFSMRPIAFYGRYGALVQPAQDGRSEVRVLDQHLSGFTDTGTTFGFSTDSNRTGSCTFNGTSRTQNGETVTASGVGRCSGDPQPPQIPWSMTVDPTPHGFTGTFTGNIGSAKGLVRANFAASRDGPSSLQGMGYINDLWFPPNEGGWGLNLIEQGDTAFATLFVFDAQNRPHWYSASQLIAGTQGGRPSWTGLLEESTGPYFGAPFNASSVTRRVVGTMTFVLQENGDGSLGYTVNGTTVAKRVNRFAFRKNDLTGNYQGIVRGDGYDDATFAIDDQGDRVNMTIDIFTGSNCNYAGKSIQYGSQRSVYGTYTCQGGRQGTFEMNDIMVTAQGFTGTFQGPPGHSSNLITNGRMSGARR